MKRTAFILLLISIPSFFQLAAQNNPIEKILEDNKPLFGDIVAMMDSFEVQIIYTQIDRDQNNFPLFTTYKYRVDPAEYFYPASSVKLPVALLALEKLNNLGVDGLNKYSPLKIDSSRAPQSAVISDSSSESYLPSIANYVKKIFLVSDNDAYNRLYEFIGQREINDGLHKKGFKDLKIVHRFAGGFSPEENRYTNPFQFFRNDKIIYRQEEQYNDESYLFELKKLSKGIGYIDAGGKLINQPFDFSAKNYISLETLTEILKTVLFPEASNSENRFNLTENDYQFLYRYMSMLPRESKYPAYDSTHYDSYVKYFIFGDSHKPFPGNIRIFNKVGMAYGYLTDVSYIVDFEKNVEFMLSAVIHVNKNRIYNDGIYEYTRTGLPFLANLGRMFYSYESNRVKKYLPDLSKFRLIY